MKFSIVTISFNQAAFLEQAIRSVIDQHGVALEYIVVDAGSTDRSREIIERHRGRIDRVVLEPDRGPADGLNKGFAGATGDVFGFLNSDDYLLPGALTRVAAFLAANPDVDVVSGHALIVDGDDRVLRRAYSDRYSARMEALGAVALMQPSTFFRAGRFRQAGGFNPDNTIAWDGELFFRMHRFGARFAIIDELLSAYRVHAESITGSASRGAAIRAFRERTFREFFGRKPRPVDRLLTGGARLIKHCRNLRGVRERLLHGPIYGRFRDG